jgi:putative hydroxymethylpyrimidine transport system ATP-binding protein
VTSIRFNSVDLRFGRIRVFKGLSFDVQSDRLTCVLGRSGIGKTSLIKLVAGLILPDSGSVELSDTDRGEAERGGASSRAGMSMTSNVTYMPQHDSLLEWLSIENNVMLGARLRGRVTNQHRQRANELLEATGMSGRAKDLPGTLSGGMRQRVALARTLFEDKPIVLMDEPFSSVDAITHRTLQDLSVSLLQRRTVMLVTHNPSEAARVAQNVVVLGERATLFSPPGDTPRTGSAEKNALDQIWQCLGVA